MTLLQRLLAAVLGSSLAAWSLQPSLACSRAVCFGLEGQTVTGRSMDWLEDMQTNLWIFPRGMERDGGMGNQGLQWTSKYGSVVARLMKPAQPMA
jgi:penicillin V acylase-like amidase (Ntn superfamily)